MSKVLRISQGGYKIITEPGSEIKLDTGLGIGKVKITGDLIVEGDSTKIQTSVLEVEDNIVIINKANTVAAATFPGIVNGQAGIEIQRGQESDGDPDTPHLRFVYDDSLSYFPPNNVNLNIGAFVFKRVDNNQLVGITTNFIQTLNSDLHFNTGDAGKISIRTSGATPYEERLSDNDDIPNLKYIKSYVRAEAGSAIIEKISRYYQDEDDAVFDTKTGVEARDALAGDLSTGVFFTVALGPPGPNGTLGAARQVFQVGNFNRKGLFVGDNSPIGGSKPHLKLYVNEPPPGNTIDTKYSYIETDNGPLVLNPEDGLVKLKNKLEIENLQVTAPNPLPVSNTNTIYSRIDQGAGGTGIYFSNTVTSGEICSAAKALVYGLIF
jgi:hypothetical protein